MSSFLQFFPNGGGSSGGGGGIPATTTVAELLIVAGGQAGGGPSWCDAGGGHGGGVLSSRKFCFEQGCSYTVTVGAGGAHPSGDYSVGENSSIIGYNAPPTYLVAHAAAISCDNPAASNYLKALSMSTETPNEQIDAYTWHHGGKRGQNVVAYGPGVSPNWTHYLAGAAGGAGGDGCNSYLDMGIYSSPCPTIGPFYICTKLTGVSQFKAAGGYKSDISATTTYYGGGGGARANCICCCYTAVCGAVGQPTIVAGMSFNGDRSAVDTCNIPRSPGGGGCYCTPSSTTGAATANSGGGGGFASNGSCTTANGAAGVVFIRYPDEYQAATSISGNTPTPAQSGYRVYRFNGDGSITF